MVGPPFDCLANPLGAVRLTFDKAISSGLDPSASDGKDWGVLDLFRRFLSDNSGLDKVPVLNATSVPYVRPNTLVRFRAMVQDMLGNELYVGAYKDGCTWKTNKYSDYSQCQVDLSPDMRLWERRLLYCVPVPGLNSWADPLESLPYQHDTAASLQREKRQRGGDDASVDYMDLGTNQDCEDSPSTKRMREEGNPSSSTRSLDSTDEGCNLSSTKSTNLDQTPFPCLVKVYDSQDSDLKLNEVFEFIGVLNFDSESTLTKDESDQLPDSVCEDELVQQPAGKIPRIHCIIHRKLGLHDFINGSPMTEPNPSMIRGIREGLLNYLTSVLGNDGVAAHFLLLHLLSRVHARVDSVAVGKLSLNLTCFSKETASIFARHLGLAVEKLLPFAKRILLSIDYLNSSSLSPKKDYQTNKLVSGVLQLAEGSHLTVDETQLQAGILNSNGVENARALKILTESQKVEYDFQYYKMEMTADVQLLVLSEGKSNIMPADLVIPFHPSLTNTLDNGNGDEAALQAWRWYLATLRSLSHSISPDMLKVVEDDLVAARQADRSLDSQDLSRLLTMGRLMSLSYGETCLSMEHWQMVKELERIRKERLK